MAYEKTSDVIQRKLQEAEEAEEQGDTETAERLRREVETHANELF